MLWKHKLCNLMISWDIFPMLNIFTKKDEKKLSILPYLLSHSYLQGAHTQPRRTEALFSSTGLISSFPCLRLNCRGTETRWYTCLAQLPITVKVELLEKDACTQKKRRQI